MQRRLERSTTNRVLSGVCGGLAEYLAIDATLVRAFFVVCTVVTAFLFLLVYIALLILMPLPGHRPPIDDLWPSARTGDPASTGAGPAGEGGTPPAPVTPNGHDADRRRNAIGYVLVALGFVFMLGNLGAFRLVQWHVIWPAALIALGVLLLVQRSRP